MHARGVKVFAIGSRVEVHMGHYARPRPTPITNRPLSEAWYGAVRSEKRPCNPQAEGAGNVAAEGCALEVPYVSTGRLRAS